MLRDSSCLTGRFLYQYCLLLFRSGAGGLSMHGLCRPGGRCNQPKSSSFLCTKPLSSRFGLSRLGSPGGRWSRSPRKRPRTGSWGSTGRSLQGMCGSSLQGMARTGSLGRMTGQNKQWLLHCPACPQKLCRNGPGCWDLRSSRGKLMSRLAMTLSFAAGLQRGFRWLSNICCSNGLLGLAAPIFSCSCGESLCFSAYSLNSLLISSGIAIFSHHLILQFS